MAVLYTIPTVTRLAGTSITVPAQAVPLGNVRLSVVLDVTAMTLPTQHFDAVFDVSYDGGATWQLLVGASRDGFTLLDDLGAVVGNAEFGNGIAQPDNVNRQVRGSIAISGVSFVLGGTVSVV